MGVQRNRGQWIVVVGKTSNEDIEEKKVWFGDGEEEGASIVYGPEVTELVGELGDGGDVVLVSINDNLGVPLCELG